MAVAVVSGGTRGIGRALVFRFAQAGFDVAYYARNTLNVQELENSLRVQYPGQKFLGICADAAIRAQVEGFASAVIETLGTPDVLINNAGIFLPGSVGTEDEGTFDLLWQVNVAAAYHLTRYFYKAMVARGSGHIFNICSTASIMAYPNGGSYCITKWALLGMSKVLREELKNKCVKVTAVLPGATLTDSWAGRVEPESRFIPAGAIAESIYTCFALPGNTVVEEMIIRPQEGDLG